MGHNKWGQTRFKAKPTARIARQFVVDDVALDYQRFRGCRYASDPIPPAHEQRRQTQPSRPRGAHAVIVFAIHDSPLLFINPQVLRLGLCRTLHEHFVICLYNFSCRWLHLIDLKGK